MTEREIRLTEFTEPLSKLTALLDSHFFGNMEIHALVSITAEAIFRKEPALWHFPEIVFVHEFAAVALLA